MFYVRCAVWFVVAVVVVVVVRVMVALLLYSTRTVRLVVCWRRGEINN